MVILVLKRMCADMGRWAGRSPYVSVVTAACICELSAWRGYGTFSAIAATSGSGALAGARTTRRAVPFLCPGRARLRTRSLACLRCQGSRRGTHRRGDLYVGRGCRQRHLPPSPFGNLLRVRQFGVPRDHSHQRVHLGVSQRLCLSDVRVEGTLHWGLFSSHLQLAADPDVKCAFETFQVRRRPCQQSRLPWLCTNGWLFVRCAVCLCSRRRICACLCESVEPTVSEMGMVCSCGRDAIRCNQSSGSRSILRDTLKSGSAGSCVSLKSASMFRRRRRAWRGHVFTIGPWPYKFWVSLGGCSPGAFAFDAELVSAMQDLLYGVCWLPGQLLRLAPGNGFASRSWG